MWTLCCPYNMEISNWFYYVDKIFLKSFTVLLLIKVWLCMFHKFFAYIRPKISFEKKCLYVIRVYCLTTCNNSNLRPNRLHMFFVSLRSFAVYISVRRYPVFSTSTVRYYEYMVVANEHGEIINSVFVSCSPSARTARSDP